MHKVSYASLEAGQRFVGPGRTLTETDHGIFMMLVGDWVLCTATLNMPRLRGSDSA